MATHTIYVNATKADPFPPELSDDEGHNAHTQEGDKNMTTEVGPGDEIIWRAGGDITSLQEITYNGGTDLFVTPPSQQTDGTWRGVVGPNLPDGANEEYNISYIVDNGMFYTQDPKLRFRPSIGS